MLIVWLIIGSNITVLNENDISLLASNGCQGRSASGSGSSGGGSSGGGGGYSCR
jgi:hypothetical protein